MWQDAQAAHAAGRVRVTGVRASDYFGPGYRSQSHLGERFVPRLLDGRSAQFVVGADQPHSWTYVPDVANAVATVGCGGADFARAALAHGHECHSMEQPMLGRCGSGTGL